MAALKQPRYDDLTKRQRELVDRAVHHGVPRYAAVCIMDSTARYQHISFAVGLALIEGETGFRHVFGHDPTIFIGAGAVTRAKYRSYRSHRRASGNRLMQGVGLGQLTWWQTQDFADERGGCHKRYVNVDVSVQTLAARIRDFGYAKGWERYNGTGRAAELYSIAGRRRAAAWRRRLKG